MIQKFFSCFLFILLSAVLLALPHQALAFDVFFNAQALLQLNLRGKPPMSVLLSGPVQVQGGETVGINRTGPRSVATEILSMNLNGSDPQGLAVNLNSSRSNRSIGRVEEKSKKCPSALQCPANSFFDVFFEIQMMTQLPNNAARPAFFDVFVNHQPAHLEAVVGSLMNLKGVYRQNNPVKLYPLDQEVSITQSDGSVGTAKLHLMLQRSTESPVGL